MINLPSEVMPTTRARTDPLRPRDGFSEFWPALPRRDLDATDFLICEVDGPTLLDRRSAFAWAVEFASEWAGAELSGVAPAEF